MTSNLRETRPRRTAWGGRWGLWFRPLGRRRPWLLLGHCGSIECATDAMYAVMGASESGDWYVSRLDRPPRPARQKQPSPRGM